MADQSDNVVLFSHLVEARQRIASGVMLTPCRESFALSEMTGCRVFIKLEYLQRTGSFKERGARNALMCLNEDQKKRGVVAASAGNHALALAFHGRDLGIPVTVVMPTIAPLVKQVRCGKLGAKVLLHGSNIAEAKDRADELVAAEGLTYIHGFDAPEVIAGAGTVGLEILEQVPEADAIVVPIGGAGLIAGIGIAVKTMKPSVQVIGVEPACAASYAAAVEAGGPVMASVRPTLGDGLAVPRVGDNAFKIAQERVDKILTVEEDSIALAILRILENERGVVEGSGAAPLAALLSGQLPELKGKSVVLVLCGGNIDPNVLGRIIEYGLVEDGRLARFFATISDRPGGLAKLTATIAEAGASVKQIIHERAFASADVSTVEVECIVETRDHAHLDRMLGMLEAAGIRCKR